MSINSKAKRDARKKTRKPASTSPTPPTAQIHAQLVDGGEIIGGAARQHDEWQIILNGRVVARTDSAAMVMATLQHVARLREPAGHAISLSFSKTVRDAATAEAAVYGVSLQQHLDTLEAERAERSTRGKQAPTTPPDAMSATTDRE